MPCPESRTEQSRTEKWKNTCCYSNIVTFAISIAQISVQVPCMMGQGAIGGLKAEIFISSKLPFSSFNFTVMFIMPHGKIYNLKMPILHFTVTLNFILHFTASFWLFSIFQLQKQDVNSILQNYQFLQFYSLYLVIL